MRCRITYNQIVYRVVVRCGDERGVQYDYFSDGPFGARNSRLDSVFLVGDVPYRWHRLEHMPIPG